MDQNNKKKIKLEDLPDLLTVREVSDLLRVSPLTIKRWGKRGKLPAIRINSRGDKIQKRSCALASWYAIKRRVTSKRLVQFNL